MLLAKRPYNEFVRLQSLRSLNILDTSHVKELPRNTSFCGHAICDVNSNNPQRRIYEVCDTRLDPRFFDNPLVVGDPWIQSYLGYVLQSESGSNLGTLCVIDSVPRKYSESKKQLLILLGSMVENIIHGHHHLAGIEQKFI